jgi:hypothetical protein
MPVALIRAILSANITIMGFSVERRFALSAEFGSAAAFPKMVLFTCLMFGYVGRSCHNREVFNSVVPFIFI